MSILTVTIDEVSSKWSVQEAGKLSSRRRV